MTDDPHGSTIGIDLHKFKGTKLCPKCLLQKHQQTMIRLFNSFSNWELDPSKPRLLSLHYFINPIGNRQRRTRINKRDTTLPNDAEIRDYYEYPRYQKAHDIEVDGEKYRVREPRKIQHTAWGTDEGDLERLKVQEQGLCTENSSSVKVPGGYQGPEIAFGMNSEEPDAMRVNKDTCNACPVQGKCLQTGLQTVDLTGMLGGRTPTERTHLRKVISRGLGSLDNQTDETTRAFDMPGLLRGEVTRETEPGFIDTPES